MKIKINWRNVIGAVTAIGGLLKGIAWLIDANQRVKEAKNRPNKAEELKQQNLEKLDFLEKAAKIKVDAYRAKKRVDQEYAGGGDRGRVQSRVHSPQNVRLLSGG